VSQPQEPRVTQLGGGWVVAQGARTLAGPYTLRRYAGRRLAEIKAGASGDAEPRQPTSSRDLA